MISHCILVDTREKQPWFSVADQPALGSDSKFVYSVKNQKLETGDYTLEGFERILCVERKKSISELAQNIFSERFINELKRLSKIKFAFVVCEFNLNDVMMYPYNTGIPRHLWKSLPNCGLVLSKIIEYELKYNVRFVYAGKHGPYFAQKLFRRILRNP